MLISISAIIYAFFCAAPYCSFKIPSPKTLSSTDIYVSDTISYKAYQYIIGPDIHFIDYFTCKEKTPITIPSVVYGLITPARTSHLNLYTNYVFSTYGNVWVIDILGGKNQICSTYVYRGSSQILAAAGRIDRISTDNFISINASCKNDSTYYIYKLNGTQQSIAGRTANIEKLINMSIRRNVATFTSVQPGTIEITNSMGQLISKIQLYSNSPQDVALSNEGVYFVKFETPNGHMEIQQFIAY